MTVRVQKTQSSGFSVLLFLNWLCNLKWFTDALLMCPALPYRLIVPHILRITLSFFKESCEFLKPGKGFEISESNMISQSKISPLNFNYFVPLPAFFWLRHEMIVPVANFSIYLMNDCHQMIIWWSSDEQTLALWKRKTMVTCLVLFVFLLPTVKTILDRIVKITEYSPYNVWKCELKELFIPVLVPNYFKKDNDIKL